MEHTRQWGAIFDLDGTMVANRDFHERAWIEVCSRHGLAITHESYQQLIHARINDVIMRNLFSESMPQEEKHRIAHEKELAYRTMYREYVAEIKGLKKLLGELHGQGVPCAVASSSPYGNVELVLTGLAVKDCFDAIITADDVTHGKPDPEIFLIAASKIRLDIRDCVIFEDSPAGFEAARRSGAIFIAITAGNEGVEHGEMAGAAAICHDFSALDIGRIRALLPSAIGHEQDVPHGWRLPPYQMQHETKKERVAKTALWGRE